MIGLPATTEDAIAEMNRLIEEVSTYSQTNRFAERNAGFGEGLQKAIDILRKWDRTWNDISERHEGAK